MCRRFLSSVPVLSAILVVGCQDEAAPDSEFAVRDSAGIEIVESSSPLLGPNAWTVSEEPVLEIGQVEGEEGYTFSGMAYDSEAGIGGVFRQEDGRIVVADRRERTVRIFDSSGAFLEQFGRTGGGPGEFISQPLACFQYGDRIAVTEMSRVSFFDPDGQFLERIDLQFGRAQIFGVFPDKSVLALSTIQGFNPLAPPSTGVYTDTGELWIIGPDGSASDRADTINSKRTSLVREGEATYTLSQPFGSKLVLRVVSDEYVYGWPDHYELKVFDRTGAVRKIIRRSGDLLPVTAEDREWLTSLLENGMQEEMLRILTEGMTFPSHKAAFDRLLVDALGFFWVRTPARLGHWEWAGQPSPYWDVFDPSGRWLTSVTMPENVQIHDIGEDYILGVWQDELDVPYVRMYGLDRQE